MAAIVTFTVIPIASWFDTELTESRVWAEHHGTSKCDVLIHSSLYRCTAKGVPFRGKIFIYLFERFSEREGGKDDRKAVEVQRKNQFSIHRKWLQWLGQSQMEAGNPDVHLGLL